MASKTWFEVRVRECVAPGRFTNGVWIDGRYVKKSKFFLARDSKDAAGRYKGKGYIMSVEKVSRERLLGIGEFFTLGDSLLKELKGGGGLLEQLENDKEKRRSRRGSYARQRKNI